MEEKEMEPELEFIDHTQEVSCIKVKALQFSEMRQLTLGPDMGIWLVDKVNQSQTENGEIKNPNSKRIDVVSKGHSQSPAFYFNENEIGSVDWIKFKNGNSSKPNEMDIGGILTAENIQMKDKKSISIKLEEMEQYIKTCASQQKEMMEKIDDLTKAIVPINEFLQTVQQQIDSIEGLNVKSMKLYSNDQIKGPELGIDEWHFVASSSLDGKPTLNLVCNNTKITEYCLPLPESRKSAPNTPIITRIVNTPIVESRKRTPKKKNSLNLPPSKN